MKLNTSSVSHLGEGDKNSDLWKAGIKLLVIMKLTTILITFFALQVGAKTFSQKVTIDGESLNLQSIFNLIEKQTGFQFVYTSETLQNTKPVSLKFENADLKDVLDYAFRDQRLVYTISEKIIVIKPNPADDLNRRLDEDDFSRRSLFSPPAEPIRGVVQDLTGMLLNGATVMNKRTKKSSQTNAKGEFTIDGEEGDALTISYVGFESQNIKVVGNNLRAVLRASNSPLDEVQIKAYGTTSKRLNTGNITTIRAAEIEKQPVSDPILTLQGRVPGMTITQTTGLAGGKVDVQIRGRNSIASGTQPLFIVDGVPYDANSTAPSGDYYGALSNVISGLNFLSPTDIENIDVLKDADATAIYGSRGGNGVVLITTKKGKAGEVRANVNVSAGIQQVGKKMKLLNTEQYLELRNEAFKNDHVLPTNQNAPDLLVWDTARYTNWQKILIGGTANYTDAQASLNGGNNLIQYLIGGNYHRETTVFSGNFSTLRGGSHLNISGNSADQRLKVSFTGSYVLNNTNYPDVDFANYVMLAPNAPTIYDSRGNLNWENSTWYNPFSMLVSSISEIRGNNMITNIDVSYQVLNDLTLKANIGYNELSVNNFRGNLLAGMNPADAAFSTASAAYSTSKLKSWISEPQVSYKKMLGTWNLDVLAGITFLSNRNEGQNVNAYGISQDALVRFPEAASQYVVFGRGSKYKYASVFSRLGLNFSDKYLLNLTLRRDGSSRFGPNKQFATFGAVGGAWVFSQEELISKLLPALSFGKLRGSYGITGNDQIGDYQYLDQYSFVEQPYQGEKGLRSFVLFNPNFSWEKTNKFELGLELGFLKDRILLTSSFYNNSSSNQLMNTLIASMVGATDVLRNLPATIRNRGVEFTLSSQNMKSKTFTWNTSFNLSRSRNTLISKKGVTALAFAEGSSLSTKYLYEYLGVNPDNGAFLFADRDGKPVEKIHLANARRDSMDLAPNFFGGIQNTFKYKAFQLDIFFQYVKQIGFSGLFPGDVFPGGFNKNMPIEILSRWRQPGDESSIQRASQNFARFQSYDAWLSSNESYGDASFIRCKNISISWNTPARWNKGLHINTCRIFLNGQNLFTITKYPGWDPETRSVQVIPPLRVFTGGIQLSL